MIAVKLFSWPSASARALIGCAALFTLACNRNSDEPMPASEPETAPAEQAAEMPRESESTAGLTPSEPTTKVDGIPTEMDYEQEAANRITPDNLEAELDRLEQEIDAE